MVSHHLDLLDGFDRVLVFDAGRLVADGRPAAGAIALWGEAWWSRSRGAVVALAAAVGGVVLFVYVLDAL